MKVLTPVVGSVKAGGVEIPVHAVTLAMVRRCTSADTPERQMEAVADIVDAVCEMPEGMGRPSEVLGMEECNRVVSMATGQDGDADFPRP